MSFKLKLSGKFMVSVQVIPIEAKDYVKASAQLLKIKIGTHKRIKNNKYLSVILCLRCYFCKGKIDSFRKLMEIVTTGIEGLVEIIPQVFGDNRGYFLEAYHKKKFTEAGIPVDFVQDNQSFSAANVLRGLHFQEGAYAQGKLVRVIKGRVLDVAVDIRKNSPTFGRHYKCILDDSRHNMLYVPEGFAHGFLTLEESIFFYKCTNYYHKEAENGIIWNDPDLNIDWQISDPNISEKDKYLISFQEYRNSLNQ